MAIKEHHSNPVQGGSGRPAILLTRLWPEPALEHLSARYDVTVDTSDRPLDGGALADAMRRFDALCPTVSDRLDADVIGTANARVRVIANYGVGFEHIDLAAARAAGIVVTNTPDVLTETTAELAILLMLTAARRAGEGERELRAGRWSGWRPTHLVGSSLRGKHLGLVGFGRIAQATARYARDAFGMTISYYSRRRVPAADGLQEARYVENLDTLIAESDVVSLHCPGGKETYHLVDADRLKCFKPSAILINTARGSIVDDVALAAALRDGRLASAGLDVYPREPQVAHELLTLENVVLLPHLGSATLETRTAMGMRVADNLDAFFKGVAPPDRVA